MITTEKTTAESVYIDITDIETVPVTILADYREQGASGVIDAGTISARDTRAFTKAGIEAINAIADTWNHPEADETAPVSAPACSCCFKTLEDGTVVMGRNMDLPISFSPAVIFRTEGDGENTYDTVNIYYVAPGHISFDQVAESGVLPKQTIITMVNTACDTLNSEGLYIEFNMRECEDCKTSSTNPQSDKRVCCINLNRLIGDHCATIEEAIEYVKGLDVYDPQTAAFDWSMAIAMMDRTGRYGVLEFVNNEIVWNEGCEGFACGQANFYWAPEAKNVRFGAGKGRWRKLMEQYYDIASEADMEEAMQSIRYSQFITNGDKADYWEVDWITEVNDKIPYFVKNRLNMIYDWRDTYGIKLDENRLEKVLEVAKREEENEGVIWSLEFLNDPANYYDVITFMDFFIDCFEKLPVDAKKASGYYEASAIGYTATNRRLGYRNRFFEMGDIYHIGLYETAIETVEELKEKARKEVVRRLVDFR